MDARPELDQATASEPRQRWRLVVSRAASAPRLAQRDVVDSWETAVRLADLPVATSAGSTPRPKIAFGAPLPIGMAAEGELVDVYLTERWPRWRVREALEPVVPEGWRLVDLLDVWLGGPALAGAVAAAEYRIALDGASADEITEVTRTLMAATVIPRTRERGGKTVEDDLRPLLVDVAVRDPGPPVVVMARTRFHPSLGTGRPEEVVAAIGAVLGRSLTIASIVRERLILAEDVAGFD